MTIAPFTLAISAGGKSTRMGTDKAFVQIAGRTMIERILQRVSGLGYADLILITNQPEKYASFGLPMFADVLPDSGSLGGIYTALHHAQHDDVLVLSCDTPFVNPAVLTHLLSLRSAEGAPFDVIVPRVEGYPEGLQAVYRKACLPAIRARIDERRLNVIGFYPSVAVRYVDEVEYLPLDPERLSFFNVNTPDDLAQAEDIARRLPDA